MAIAAENVCKRFDEFVALDDVSISVPEGSLTALLGPSGSGKSTLLRVIAGLEAPDAGRVMIHGQDATAVRPQERGVGFVFQHYAAFKHMTVWNNIAFGLSIRKRSKQEIKARVDELLELVHLEGFADRYPAQLSGGQRQRMALARALAVEPKVLLLDEPFGALDARVRKDLRIWLRRLHDEVHVTTIFVTHDQEEAMDVAEQIVVMNDGRVEQTGKPRDIYEQPANEFVMSFIGPVNRLGDNELIRPHDFELMLEPNGSTDEAMIDRIVHLGFEVRVEFSLNDGRQAWAQMTRAEADQLELHEGQIVFVRPDTSKVFTGDAASGDAAPEPA
jgi:sulfate/thiosulfate transport system ATP-binding protein